MIDIPVFWVAVPLETVLKVVFSAIALVISAGFGIAIASFGWNGVRDPAVHHIGRAFAGFVVFVGVVVAVVPILIALSLVGVVRFV